VPNNSCVSFRAIAAATGAHHSAVHWGDVPTWVIAGATVLAFVAAGFAVYFQWKTLENQRLQIQAERTARLEERKDQREAVVVARKRVLTVAIDELEQAIRIIDRSRQQRRWGGVRVVALGPAYELVLTHASDYSDPIRAAFDLIAIMNGAIGARGELQFDANSDIDHELGELADTIRAARDTLTELRAALDTPQAGGQWDDWQP